MQTRRVLAQALRDNNTSATLTVGPDGDVYFGMLEDPFPGYNDRGWLLHFYSDLSQGKDSRQLWLGYGVRRGGGAGAVLQGHVHLSAHAKYNNYAGIATGNDHNKIAILDPNATERDPIDHKTRSCMTPDPDFPGFTGGVREWCIDTAAVDPFGKSVLANSEDGKLYRWDLTAKKLSERIKPSNGIGEAYTPTVIGPDGTVYAINDAVLFAIGQ